MPRDICHQPDGGELPGTRRAGVNGKGDGYLRITQNRKARQTEGTGILFGAVYRAFMDIAEEYPGNIEIDLAGKEDWP